MNKAFVREDSDDDEDDAPEAAEPVGAAKNYITPAGHARLKAGR